jgi:hypothetical protein
MGLDLANTHLFQPPLCFGCPELMQSSIFYWVKAFYQAIREQGVRFTWKRQGFFREAVQRPGTLPTGTSWF